MITIKETATRTYTLGDGSEQTFVLLHGDDDVKSGAAALQIVHLLNEVIEIEDEDVKDAERLRPVLSDLATMMRHMLDAHAILAENYRLVHNGVFDKFISLQKAMHAPTYRLFDD